MKKLILLLLITIYGYGQPPVNGVSYPKVKITANVVDDLATYVNVQSSDGSINKMLRSSIVPLKASTTVSGTVKTDVNQADPIVYTKASTDTYFEIKANKQNNLTGSDVTKYPTVPAVNAGLALKANLASPSFTGVPTVPTATAGTNTTQAASTAFVLANGLNIPQLEFNNTDKTVWNNGKGDISSNTSFGESALYSNTTGIANTANGANALQSNTTGNSNTANGHASLPSNTTGAANTATGYVSLQSNTTGNSNTAIGASALQSNTTGNSNTANGYRSGHLIADGIATNAITNNSVFLGANTKALANNQTNQIVIGYDAIGAGSNTATLGNTNITSTVLRGAVTATSFARTGGSVNDAQMANGTVKAIGNVDNTTDLNKPISTATQTAFGGKFDKTGGFLNGAITLPTTGALPNLRFNFTNAFTDSRSWFIGNDLFQYGSFGIATETGQGSNALLSRFHINPYGDVGIGTVTPTEKLDVVGNGKFSGTVKATGLAVYADNTTAIAGGLAVGTMYRTSLGIVMIVY